MRILPLLSLLLLPLSLFGQTQIQGSIIDKLKGEQVPFATVGLIKENIGGNADENGQFSITSTKQQQDDTLIVSSMGYQTRKVPLSTLSQHKGTIALSPLPTALKEVVVRNDYKWTYSTLNDFSGCGHEFVSSSGYHTQLAQHFDVGTSGAILSSVAICRFSIPLIAREKARFRIRVYDMDPVTRAPSTDLCNQVIEVSTKSSHVVVDMQPYNILIPNKDFFVAVEWLKIPYNEQRVDWKGPNGEKQVHISYSPSIGWTKQKNDTMQAWVLNYKNEWSLWRSPFNKTSVSIAATLKY
jgi:hypothetical protein